MKLTTYIKRHEPNASAFARKIGITRHLLYAYYERANPTLENAIKIVKATKGKVGYKDLLVRKRA